MAQHDVTFTIPERALGKADLEAKDELPTLGHSSLADRELQGGNRSFSGHRGKVM